jgi:hypothetical protein
MAQHWNAELSAPLTFSMDGQPRSVNTLEDARGLLETQGISEARPNLIQAASTAVTEAAHSGQPSDLRLATEQIRVLLQSLNWI